MDKFEGLVVIGAGLPRTGTASLRTALSTLLNSPIYHMFEVIQNGSKDIEFWSEACAKKKTKEEWNNLFKGRKSHFWTSIRFMLRSVSFIPYELNSSSVQDYLGAVDYPAALFYR